MGLQPQIKVTKKAMMAVYWAEADYHWKIKNDDKKAMVLLRAIRKVELAIEKSERKKRS